MTPRTGDDPSASAAPVLLHASQPLPDAVTADGVAASARSEATRELAGLLQLPPAVELTSSCTHALEAAATVLGIGHGDEVVVPAYAFPSAANAFVLRGARLRFADVDPLTGNIDPADVERLVGPRTRAVVCVHYGGVACDVGTLGEMASADGWDLVEDAAHSLFGSLDGRPLGRFGRLGCFSFHHTKNISAVDGGAIVVNDPDLVDATRIAIDKGTNRVDFEAGRVTSYEWAGPGSAWRMPDINAVILAERLRGRDAVQARRHAVWAQYATELAPWAERVGATLPHVPDGVDQPAHLFWVVLPAERPRDEFVRRCAERGVQVARHFGSLPDSAFGRRLAAPDETCPRSQVFAERLVRLPLHHQLSDDDVERVLEAVRS